MTGAVTLREMTAADLPAVLDLEHALFGDEAWTEGMLASELAGVASGRYYLVAEDGAEHGRRTRPAYPRRRAQADVLDAGRGRAAPGPGPGAALLDALLAEAGRRGCTEVFLEVRVDNHRAQLLYQRRGVRGDRHPARLLPAIGTDALVMRLSLDRLGRAAPAPAARAGTPTQ